MPSPASVWASTAVGGIFTHFFATILAFGDGDGQVLVFGIHGRSFRLRSGGDAPADHGEHSPPGRATGPGFRHQSLGGMVIGGIGEFCGGLRRILADAIGEPRRNGFLGREPGFGPHQRARVLDADPGRAGRRSRHTRATACPGIGQRPVFVLGPAPSIQQLAASWIIITDPSSITRSSLAIASRGRGAGSDAGHDDRDPSGIGVERVIDSHAIGRDPAAGVEVDGHVLTAESGQRLAHMRGREMRRVGPERAPTSPSR